MTVRKCRWVGPKRKVLLKEKKKLAAQKEHICRITKRRIPIKKKKEATTHIKRYRRLFTEKKGERGVCLSLRGGKKRKSAKHNHDDGRKK